MSWCLRIYQIYRPLLSKVSAFKQPFLSKQTSPFWLWLTLSTESLLFDIPHWALVPHYHTSTSHNPWLAKCYCTSVVVPIRSWTLCYCVFWPGSTTFKALLSWTSVKAGAHTHSIAAISMRSIDSYQCSQMSLHHSIGKPTWPLLQCVGCEVVKYQH